MVDALAEAGHPLPKPTPFEKISLPKGCKPIAHFAVAVEPPNPSERVNVYLPKNLIAQADKKAEELGMSRSSFFGLAVTSLIGRSQAITSLISRSYADVTSLTKPRSKIRTAGKPPLPRTKG